MFERNLHKIRVPVHQITIGMYVCDLDRPWLDTPFPVQGFEVTSPEDIQLISDICEYIYIDVKKSKLNQHIPETQPVQTQATRNGLFKRLFRRPNESSTAKDGEQQPYKDKHSVEEELENAGNAYRNTKDTVNEILENFKLGRDININQARRVVNECVESIFNNKDSLLWFTLIKNRDLYTSEHCLNVAILSIAFGRHLGHSEKTLKTIGLCGLLHDVGKVKIPLEVLNKEGTFTQEEFEIMKQHPVHGRDYLEKQSDIIPEAIDVTYGHHEKIDGSGYPQGLRGSQIPYFAKLVAITDAYDAITSDRSYQNARSTLQAQKILYEAAGSHFDEELIKGFIQWLGIYPPGSIVEMTNGEAGIVLSVNPKYKLKPRVVLLVDEEKHSRPQRIVDLSRIDLDRQGKEYKIKTSHPNNTFGIDLTEYQQKGLVLQAADQQSKEAITSS